MSRPLTPAALAPLSSRALRSPLRELAPHAEDFAAAARAPATRRAYASSWRAFAAWSTAQGHAPLPAEPALVALYLTHLAREGRRPATLDRALAAIAAQHRDTGHAWIKGHPTVGRVRAGIRRSLGTAPRQKAPVEDEDLRRLVLALPATLTGLRDRALLLLGWVGALRRSELVGLDVGDVLDTRDGLLVALRRSKTDPEGAGAVRGLPPSRDPVLCPVLALRAWLRGAGLGAGPLFRPINQHGQLDPRRLSGWAVGYVVKRAARAAGLDPSTVAGHSLRAGFATTAARRGKGLDALMRQTGHRSERVARGYIRHGSVFVQNAAEGLL